MKLITVFGPVKIVQTTEEHLPEFWRILKQWPDFWSESWFVQNEEDFARWWEAKVRDALTGLDNGRVVGCGYLDTIYPGYYATINVFKEKGYLNPKMVAAIMRHALPYFFDKYDLEKIVGITRENHKGSIRLLKRIGLKVTGTLRHHAKVNGQWTDYVWSEILREEL